MRIAVTDALFTALPYITYVDNVYYKNTFCGTRCNLCPLLRKLLLWLCYVI